jgi:osmoprotectant transport system permease protein
VTLAFLGNFGGAIEFIFDPRSTRFTGGAEVGGLSQVWEYTQTHLEISFAALAVAILLALPAGAILGHLGKGEMFAVTIGNSWRAIPELVLIALVAAFIGFGFVNVMVALLVLGIAPILTNTFVGVRQVDREAVEAARAGAILVALLAVAVEFGLAGLQRLLTPRGLKLARERASA